jgi:hypothetical protein
MPSDFFTALGQQVCAELSRPSGKYPNNPSVRAELARIMNVRLNHHLTRPPPGAQDAAFDNLGARQMPRGPRYGDQSMPQPAGMIYNQDQDPASAPISGSDCLEFVRLCLAKLVGPDRDEFLSGLTDLLSPEEGGMDGSNGTLQVTHYAGNGNNNGSNGNGLRNNNQGALDRTRRNGARDNRKPGMDSAIRSLQTSSFARRFPDAANIKFGGMGR